MKTEYQIVIIGAGTAGVMTAAQLLKKDKALDVAIIDPSDKHYYQPAWTLVGAGTYDYRKTVRPIKDLIPFGATWIKDSVTGFLPGTNSVSTEKHGNITYQYLVVAPGLVNDLTLIDGLEEAVKKGVVCSNYIDPEYTWTCIRNFKGGKALFTQPGTPIKCGGAPQKIMYLAADYFRKHKIPAEITFATPGTVIFGVKEIAQTLTEVLDRYGITFEPFHTPVKIDTEKKIAYFKDTTPAEKKHKPAAKGLVEMPFDLLHLAPPQTAPKFVKESELVNEAGWLDVDIHSMQHRKYPNIFGLGDVAALPTAKTGAAVRKQAPVVTDNLLKLIRGENADNTSYQGYSSCPLVTGYGKMVLAEFNYKNEFTPDPKMKLMFIHDSYREHWRLWILKKYILPYLYWNKMMKGEDV